MLYFFFKYHVVVVLYLQPTLLYVIEYSTTTMFDGVLHCSCSVFTGFVVSLHGD